MLYGCSCCGPNTESPRGSNHGVAPLLEEDENCTRNTATPGPYEYDDRGPHAKIDAGNRWRSGAFVHEQGEHNQHGECDNEPTGTRLGFAARQGEGELCATAFAASRIAFWLGYRAKGYVYAIVGNVLRWSQRYDCNKETETQHQIRGVVPVITDPNVARELLEHIDWTPERAARYRAQRREDETP